MNYHMIRISFLWLHSYVHYDPVWNACKSKYEYEHADGTTGTGNTGLDRPSQEGDHEETDVEEKLLWHHLCKIPIKLAGGKSNKTSSEPICRGMTYKEHLEILCAGKVTAAAASIVHAEEQ